MEFFLFIYHRVFKHEELVYNLHVCSNGSRKCDLHLHLTFLQEFKPPHIRKYLIFFLHYVCRDVQQSMFTSR